jgi:hypothetical protein
MSEPTFVLIDDGRPRELPALVRDGRIALPPEALAALGWELHPEGLCRDGLCVPVPDEAGLAGPDGVDLAALARLLDRPLALDVAEGAGWLGVSAGERARALRGLAAPDFTLPDLAGRPHALREHRGRKVLLVAWASW